MTTPTEDRWARDVLVAELQAVARGYKGHLGWSLRTYKALLRAADEIERLSRCGDPTVSGAPCTLPRHHPGPHGSEGRL